jgi:2-keto-4-pentenoate hydratase/2-oxohepta-3-ene-1,7-dioic acid hydratase in catechol pathway
MKLVTYERDGRQHLATVLDGRVIDLALGMAQSGHPMLDFLAGGAVSLDAAKAQLAEAQRHWRADAYPLLDRVKLLAPIPRPGKIVAIGRNYADHAAETGVKTVREAAHHLEASVFGGRPRRGGTASTGRDQARLRDRARCRDRQTDQARAAGAGTRCRCRLHHSE